MMDKYGADPVILLAGLKAEKNLLLSQRKQLLGDTNNFQKHAASLRQINRELTDIDEEIAKITRKNNL